MNSLSKSDIDKNFGKILREFRVKHKMTQEQLSEKLGISLKYISRIENGNNGVKTQTLINYMNILGITPDLLYKPFINNPSILLNLEISEKVCSLSDDKKEFLLAIIDLLQNFKEQN